MWLLRRKLKFKILASEILEQKRLRAPSTYASAKARFRRLNMHFGELTLCAITEMHWQTFVLQRMKERPGSKFFDDKKCMRQVMLEAQRRGLVERTFRLSNPDLPSDIGREISELERARLLAHASEELRFQIEIAFLMGLRLREMLYLRWDQINWEQQTIRFLPADTKTRRGREVPINPDLVERFQRRYFVRPSRFVFPRPTDPNRPRHHNRAAWRVCKRKANVEARWHDWRHSCATTMLRRGSSVQAVKTYLGMSEQVLTRIYQHLNIDDLRNVARTMSQNATKSI